eukprot:PITA_07519
MNNQMIEAYLNEHNKLNDSNYANWKFKMQTQLEVQSAWTVANGDEQKPKARSTFIPNWEKREGKARTLLKMSVKDCIIPHIRKCKLASEIWRILKDLYEIRNTNCLLFLNNKILSLKMEENEAVAFSIVRIKDLKRKLADIGETVADADLVTITMNGVTNDYQMFITGINTREKIPKFEELTGILMQEEERRSTLKPQSRDISLMAKKKFFKGKRNLRRKTEETHKKEQIRVKKFRLFMVYFDENVDADIWYVDSGASTHMMGNRQWFKDFKEINDGSQIYLGDDRSHQIKGCGKISIILPNVTGGSITPSYGHAVSSHDKKSLENETGFLEGGKHDIRDAQEQENRREDIRREKRIEEDN